MADAQPHLAEFAPGLPEVDAQPPQRSGEPTLLVGAVGVVVGDLAALDRRVAGNEPVVLQADRPVQRVVQLGEQLRRFADLREIAPLGAGFVQPAAVVVHLDVERTVAAEVSEQVDAHAEVVRSPGLVFEVEHQAVAVGGVDQAIVGPRVVAAGGQAARIALGLRVVEHLAAGGFKLVDQPLRVGQLRAVDLDEGQPGGGRVLLAMGGLPLRVGLRWQRQPSQPLQLRQHPGFALGDQLARLGEITGGERAERWRDQHVVRLQRGEAALHVLLGQDADHLRGQAADRAQRVTAGQRRADVDRDHDVGAHRARDVDRQVVDQAAVAEDPAVGLGGGEHAGHAHARSQRQREVALAEDHRFAGFQVGGHRAKRNREPREVAHAAHRQRVASQQRLQPAARQRTERRAQLAVAHAELEHR